MPTKILFVDDEPKLQLVIRQLFKKEIQSNAFDICFALNGLEALDQLKAHPNIDIVITDINMPEMDGLTLLGELQALRPSLNPALTAIVFSAYGDMENIRKAMNAGAFDFLIKPMDFQDVRITLAKAMKHIRQVKNALRQERLAREALRKANEELEQRVEERTAEFLKANHALQESRKSLEYAQQIAHIGSWELDLVADKEKWSPEMYRIFGIDPDKLHDGMTAIFDGSVHPHDKEMLQRAREDLFTQGKNVSMEYRIVRPDGTVRYVWAEDKVFLNREGNALRVVGIVQDITERRQNEEKLKKYAKELEIAKKQAESASLAKGEFLANMSHEIRTPMNAILGFTELLNSSLIGREQKNYLEAIQAGGKSLLMLIDDILDLSKIEAGKMEIRYEPINPYLIFNDFRQIFSLKMAEKNLEFIIDIAPDIPESLLSNEVRLRQILFNLIGNAIKFTEKGHIRLAAEKICTKNNGNRLDMIIRVEDSGIGIPQNSQNTVFESFRQQDGQSTRQFGGTGLGLAISKRLVEMMDGTLSVMSEVGKGSCFEIRLNNVLIPKTSAEYEADRGFKYENIVYQKAYVLVADDIESNRVLVKEFLRNTDLSIIEAEDGKKAMARSRKIRPDVILMDIRMPIMNGYEAMKQIRANENLKNVPIIALTASALREDEEKIRRAGFDGYLRKPLQRSELFYELSRFLRYSIKKSAKTHTKTLCEKSKPEAMSSESLKMLPQVIHELENEFMRLWEITKENEFFDEIEHFGHQIKTVGERYSLKVLKQFGEELVDQAIRFDIDHMNLTLSSYPELVEKIRFMSDQMSEVS